MSARCSGRGFLSWERVSLNASHNGVELGVNLCELRVVGSLLQFLRGEAIGMDCSNNLVKCEAPQDLLQEAHFPDFVLRTCPETKVIVAGAGARMRCGSWFRRRCGEVRSLC